MLALLSYAAGLIVPIALDLPLMNLVAYNLVGACVAAVLGLGWFFVQIEARDRRHLFEWTTELRLLSSAEFEWLTGELFRREGWKIREVGRPGTADGGARRARRRERSRLRHPR